jgi:hypothetical protein
MPNPTDNKPPSEITAYPHPANRDHDNRDSSEDIDIQTQLGRKLVDAAREGAARQKPKRR